MSLKFGQIRPDWFPWQQVMMENMMFPLFHDCFYPILFILAGNDDMHESSEEFGIQPDLSTDCRVSCPLVSETIPID